MAKKTNFLIGRAEKLVKPITVKPRFAPDKGVYTLYEAQERLSDQIIDVTANFSSNGFNLFAP